MSESRETRIPGRVFFIYAIGLSVLFGIPAINFTVDPYLYFDAPRFDGFNRWKTEFFWHQFDAKARLVENAGVSVLILGTSTAGGAIDPRNAVEGDGKGFNFALAGSGPRVQRAAFRHAARSNPLRELIIGVDLFAYNDLSYNPILEAFGERMDPAATASGQWTRIRRDIERLLQNLFAWVNLRDSFATLGKQDASTGGKAQRDLRSDGMWSTPRPASMSQANAFAQIERQYLTHGWFPEPERRFLSTARGQRAGLASLRELVGEARSAGLRVTLVVMPMHARLAEAMHEAELWDDFDQLKRELVAVAEGSGGAAPAVKVWDFSGYSTVAMDPIVDSQTDTPWFHDSIHPTQATGDLMLHRMRAGTPHVDAVAADFGRELTADGLESQLQLALAQRAEYQRARGKDIEDVRRIARDTQVYRDASH